MVGAFFADRRKYFPQCVSAAAMVSCGTPGGLRSGDWCSAPLLTAALLSLLFAGMHLTTAFPSWRLEEEAHTTILVIGIRKEARSQVLHLSRNKRYTLTPEQLKWDKFKLTYKLLSFPTNLINASDTRRGIARAFGLWSDVSPFSFREVPADEEADIKIGFYPVNHTDCWQSYLHHCFDGITGELAHAFFPPTGEIHFDDHEYWILGDMRFSWKKGVWLTDIVHVATHEIGHVLGLMHSMDPKAIMHLNATLTGRKQITQDEVWGLHRLYGTFVVLRFETSLLDQSKILESYHLKLLNIFYIAILASARGIIYSIAKVQKDQITMERVGNEKKTETSVA